MKMEPLTHEEIDEAINQQVQLYALEPYFTTSDPSSLARRVVKLHKVNAYIKAKAHRRARIKAIHSRIPVFNNYWAAYAHKLKKEGKDGQRMA